MNWGKWRLSEIYKELVQEDRINSDDNSRWRQVMGISYQAQIHSNSYQMGVGNILNGYRATGLL